MSNAVVTPAAVNWSLIERRALIASAAGIVICAIAAVFSWPHFLRAYLVAWNFWMGISAGALVLLMIQYLTGGAWGLLLRRILEAAASNLLPLAILFFVLVPGLPAIYEWARPEVASSAEMQHKSIYLNPHAFVIRAAVYFILWAGLAGLLAAWSRRQDRDNPSPALAERCRTVSGLGLVIYGLTITFASIDWVMSLNPNWYSTIFPPLFSAGQILAGLAFSIAVLLVLADQAPLTRTILPNQRRDLGNLLLTFVMFWAYLSFSQFMIIWSENLPEEIPWYVSRLRGGWQWVALALVLMQFAIPFLLLLSRGAKENVKSLTAIAGLILAMRFIDLYWWIEASFPDSMGFYWIIDLAALAAIGGIWIWLFARRLQRSPLLPISDRYLAEYLPEVIA
ncbi:MAG TPA: hypothetical protein VHU84_19490 [Lacipirellulaceae bacterium]|jgi:hypothetical protein|nr:hypothetical protein [Lacipirellulaceae bacterium]